jgi:superfamily I DNA/RNA helicase/RecB family exonuclease
VNRPIVAVVEPPDWDRAIVEVEGPQIVTGGPGSGKTEFLVRRATHLIEHVVDRADEVLVLAFSRRAADALRRRILDRLGRSLTSVAASTVHSFAYRLLEAHRPGGPPALLTGPEQLALVSRLLHEEDPRTWPPALRPLLGSPTFARDVTDFLLRCAERRIDSTRLAERARRHPLWGALPGFLERYRAALGELGKIDYSTLLLDALDLLSDETVRRSVSQDHPFVLVDEYQDLSPAQVALIHQATRPSHNLTAAGEPAQSTYSFRGARVENVAEFPQIFGPDTRWWQLAVSFRVPATILDGARRLLATHHLPGGSPSPRPAEHSGTVEAYLFDQGSAEADWIAAEIERLHLGDGVPLRRIGVLVRSKRRLLNELSRAFQRRGLAHDAGHRRLVDHPAVRMLFDLVEAATAEDPEVADQAMRRLLLGELFRLPVAEERQLLRMRRAGRDWTDLLREHSSEGSAVAELLADPGWATESPAADGFWVFWETIPALGRLATDPAFRSHRAAWTAFSQTLERQRERDPRVTLRDYWEMVGDQDFEPTPLLSYRDAGDDRVTLTTMHQSKGLEFDVVFIADATEGVFPDLGKGVGVLDTHLLDLADRRELMGIRLAEEARLGYLAMTRARRRVVWTATASGIDEGEDRPSRLLLAAAGVDGVGSVPPPPRYEGPPLTARQAQARLRRLLADPRRPAGHRLAAAQVLAHPPVPLWDPRRFAGIRRPGPDRGVLDGTPILSPSQAEAYLECPRRYVLERRLGLGGESGPWALFGRLVHSVLEEADRRALSEGRPHSDLPTALAALDRVWGEGADFGSDTMNRVWRRKAVDLLQRLYEGWPEDESTTIAVEHPVAFELGGIRWVGRVDRIDRLPDGRVRVVDYKTSSTAPRYEDVEASLQLGFYVAAVAREFDSEVVAEMWIPRARGRWRRPFDPGRLDEVEERLTEAARGILDEEWTPRMGSHCRRCSVRLVCPLWPEGKEAFQR